MTDILTEFNKDIPSLSASQKAAATELKTIVDHLQGKPRVIILRGFEGVGKGYLLRYMSPDLLQKSVQIIDKADLLKPAISSELLRNTQMPIITTAGLGDTDKIASICTDKMENITDPKTGKVITSYPFVIDMGGMDEKEIGDYIDRLPGQTHIQSELTREDIIKYSLGIPGLVNELLSSKVRPDQARRIAAQYIVRNMERDLDLAMRLHDNQGTFFNVRVNEEIIEEVNELVHGRTSTIDPPEVAVPTSLSEKVAKIASLLEPEGKLAKMIRKIAHQNGYPYFTKGDMADKKISILIDNIHRAMQVMPEIRRIDFLVKDTGIIGIIEKALEELKIEDVGILHPSSTLQEQADITHKPIIIIADAIKLPDTIMALLIQNHDINSLVVPMYTVYPNRSEDFHLSILEYNARAIKNNPQEDIIINLASTFTNMLRRPGDDFLQALAYLKIVEKTQSYTTYIDPKTEETLRIYHGPNTDRNEFFDTLSAYHEAADDIETLQEMGLSSSDVRNRNKLIEYLYVYKDGEGGNNMVGVFLGPLEGTIAQEAIKLTSSI